MSRNACMLAKISSSHAINCRQKIVYTKKGLDKCRQDKIIKRHDISNKYNHYVTMQGGFKVFTKSLSYANIIKQTVGINGSV